MKLNVSEMSSTPDSSQVAKLVSCHLLEINKDGSPLWIWSYPNLSNQLRGLCLKKCGSLLSQNSKYVGGGDESSRDGNRLFRYFHLERQWFYIYLSGTLPSKLTIDESSERTPFDQIKQLGVIVGAEDFNPERYEMAAQILLRSYCKTEDPSVVLQQFLALVVDGKCSLSKQKTFTLSDYDASNPFNQHQVKSIISRFGLETILIYTALIRRRRIVVYHYDIDTLTEVILSLPALAWNSDNVWNAIYPWMDLNDEEISYIKGASFYIMGCTHAGVENRSDLYDIFINIPAAEIIVASHAKEGVAMNKSHKEMALFMVQLANNETITEEEVVQEISRKRHEVLDKIQIQKLVSKTSGTETPVAIPKDGS